MGYLKPITSLKSVVGIFVTHACSPSYKPNNQSDPHPSALTAVAVRPDGVSGSIL